MSSWPPVPERLVIPCKSSAAATSDGPVSPHPPGHSEAGPEPPVAVTEDGAASGVRSSAAAAPVTSHQACVGTRVEIDCGLLGSRVPNGLKHPMNL